MAINYENLNDGGHEELAKQIFLKIKALTDDLNSDISALGDSKVDKVEGKGLSTNDFTDEEKNKLDNMIDNIPQSDWSVTDTEDPSYILHKPTSLPASDVYAWAKAETKPEYSKSEVGLGNVPNVTTNDQTPTYTTSAELSALSSGEKLSTAFGKIAKAVADLISHIANTNNPHSVTKTQVGLGNVGNYKAVSTVANQGLTDDEKANARTNIGAGSSTFSGDYNDLANKPTIPTKVSELTNDSGYTSNAGTITEIKMNGANKGTSGSVDLGTVLTSHQDISGKADKSSTVSTVAYDSTNKKLTKTINGTTSDIVTIATIKTALALAKADVGLGNVENKSSATIRGELTKDNVTTALGYTPPTTNTTYGVVSKTANGLAPQLPNETTTTKYLRQDGTWVVPPNNNTRYDADAVCSTAAATAAKVASATSYVLRAHNRFTLRLTVTNTAQSALTLNVNSTGEKTLYINGVATSSSNYTLPAGDYQVYYNGTNYYVRTDAYNIGNAEGTASNVRGTVEVANGGTGATSAANARTNLGAQQAATQLSASLEAGSTSVSFTNNAITSTCKLQPFTSVFGVSPTAMTVSSTTVTLTFDAQSSAITVYLMIWP